MQDPLSLSIELKGIDTSIPLLPESDMVFQISESVVEPNKDQSGRNWVLTLVTTQPTTAVDGRTVNPGFPIKVIYALQPKDGTADPDAFRRMLADAIDAIFHTTIENRPDLSFEVVNSAKGRFVLGTVYHDTYNDTKSSKIRRIKKYEG